MLRAGTPENERSGFTDKGDHVAVQGAQKFVEGFLQRSTLSKDEKRALPHLIAARLATSFTRVSRRPFRRLERGVVASMAWWWCAVLRADAIAGAPPRRRRRAPLAGSAGTPTANL